MAEPIDKDTRGPVNLRIKFRSESLQQFIERYGVDVSRGGIFIRTREPLPVGTRLKLDFQLVDTAPLFQGDGTVVWIREHDASRAGVTPGMGVRFDRLTHREPDDAGHDPRGEDPAAAERRRARIDRQGGRRDRGAPAVGRVRDDRRAGRPRSRRRCRSRSRTDPRRARRSAPRPRAPDAGARRRAPVRWRRRRLEQHLQPAAHHQRHARGAGGRRRVFEAAHGGRHRQGAVGPGGEGRPGARAPMSDPARGDRPARTRSRASDDDPTRVFDAARRRSSPGTTRSRAAPGGTRDRSSDGDRGRRRADPEALCRSGERRCDRGRPVRRDRQGRQARARGDAGAPLASLVDSGAAPPAKPAAPPPSKPAASPASSRPHPEKHPEKPFPACRCGSRPTGPPRPRAAASAATRRYKRARGKGLYWAVAILIIGAGAAGSALYVKRDREKRAAAAAARRPRRRHPWPPRQVMNPPTPATPPAPETANGAGGAAAAPTEAAGTEAPEKTAPPKPEGALPKTDKTDGKSAAKPETAKAGSTEKAAEGQTAPRRRRERAASATAGVDGEARRGRRREEARRRRSEGGRYGQDRGREAGRG